MINVNSYKLIIVVYISHYLVQLILEFLPARLATLPYGLYSNVTQLLANLLTKPCLFYYLPIVICNHVSIKLLLYYYYYYYLSFTMSIYMPEYSIPDLLLYTVYVCPSYNDFHTNEFYPDVFHIILRNICHSSGLKLHGYH